MPLSKSIIDHTLASPHGEAAYGIVEALTDAGYDAWWVGGAVRDMLTGTVPVDIDIASTARPEEARAILSEQLHVREFDETGKALGSIVALFRGHPFEITTFREDDEASDGRHPESVIFGTREQDAARRDITVNAMYFHPISRELYDPFGGEKDLKERLVRFIGEPAVRIRHDALRMLRVVRFRALLDGQYHPETYAALREQSALVASLSGSRVLRELEKILAGPHPARALEDLWELQILQHVLPELADCKGIAQPADYHREGDVWDHTLACLEAAGEEDGPDVRLAALFHDCGKAKTFSLKERIRFDEHASVSADLTTEALGRLQMEGKRRDKIAWLVRHHMMMGSFDSMNDERKAHWYFHPWFAELLRLFVLDIAGTKPSDYALYESILKDYHAFLDSHPRPPKPLLTGDEVMELLGLAPGERVGEILRALHDAQVRKEVTTKKEAREFLDTLQG